MSSRKVVQITINQSPFVFTSICSKLGIPLAKDSIKTKGHLIKATVIGEEYRCSYLLGPFNNANIDQYVTLIRSIDENHNHKD